MRLNPKGLNFKITLSTVLCVFIVGGLANLYIYAYMRRIVSQKVEQIEDIQLRTVKTRVDGVFEELLELGVTCASNRSVQTAMRNTGLKTQTEKTNAINAQNTMNVFISAVSAHAYVQKLLAFNATGLMVHASNVHNGDTTDVAAVVNSALFADRNNTPGRPRFILGDSITPYGGQCFAALFPIPMTRGSMEAYLYLELSPNIISDALRPYAQVNRVFFSGGDGARHIVLDERDKRLAERATQALKTNEHSVTVDGAVYELHHMDVAASDALLWSYVNLSELMPDQQNMLFTLVIVVVTALAVALAVALLSTRYITKPVSRLISRLRKIASNDLSVDPSIESSQDEIGQVGHVVNEMVLSVSRLIDMNVQATNDIKNIEMSLLQAQVNPHFLYNTLDSIYWMATVAKNTGICNITRSLSSLLRNMAKGVGDRIPIAEEIALLEDYVAIQSVRFGGVFAFRNEVPDDIRRYAIVKMTLQPIVENAIIHGVNGSDRFGTVTLGGRADDAHVYLTVRDDGAGMTPAQVEELLRDKQERGEHRMTGIGIENVHTRLKLVYGTDCGLAIESEKGVYTRVTVTIRKELPQDVQRTAG